MTEDSGFYDDASGGDDGTATLWSSPYNAAERADYLSIIMGGDVPECFVAPGALNELKVSEKGTPDMSVDVDTGKAFMKGYIHGSTASENLIIAAADGSEPRWDRIVLQHTFADFEIRLTVLTGTPSATPALPALTQDGTTWEADLAHVYVAASVATIIDEAIWDKRQFLPSFHELINQIARQNLIGNSEHIAGASDGEVPMRTITDVLNTNSAKDDQQPRGRAIQLVSSPFATDIFLAAFPVKPSTRYCFKLLLNIDTGDDWRVRFLDDSASPVVQILDLPNKIDGWQVVTAFITTGTDPTVLIVSFEHTSTTIGDGLKVGQIMAFQGNTPGDFQETHETIFFAFPYTDTSYDGDAFSSGTVTIDLTSDFDGIFLSNDASSIEGFYFRLAINDSGSAAGTPGIVVQDTDNAETYATIDISGVPDDEVRAITFWVPALDFDLVMTASGASTLDVFLEILGVET